MSTLVGDTPQKPYPGENEANFVKGLNMCPEIKHEPPVEIDDGPQQFFNREIDVTSKKPHITLTPTMKLLATPNPADPKRKFPCPYENCTKSYGKSSHLRSHLTWHSGIKPYVCHEPNCGKSFTRSDELNRHSRTHTGEKPFECMQCAKKFSRSDHLTKHVATHTKHTQSSQKRSHLAGTSARHSSPSLPKKPALTELTEMILPEHAKRYNDSMHFMNSLLECTQFKHGGHVLEPENLTDEAHLPIRIKLERPENSDEYKVVNAAEERDSNNEFGEDEVDQKPEWARITKVEPDTGSDEDESTSDIKEPLSATTKCSSLTAAIASEVKKAVSVMNECTNGVDGRVDGGFGGGDDTNDMKNDAIMPEANAPPLPLAGAPFAMPRFGFLEEGEVDPGRPYRCKECLKCFKRQDDVNRHLRTHTGEKPYACENCDKRFKRSDHLKKHMRTHSKGR